MKFEMNLPVVSMNVFYSGTHWRKKHKIASQYHELIKWYCREKKIRKFNAPVILHFTFNNRLDIDNNGAMVKMIIDGLVRAKVFEDDNKKYIKGYSVDYDKSVNNVLIQINNI